IVGDPVGLVLAPSVQLFLSEERAEEAAATPSRADEHHARTLRGGRPLWAYAILLLKVATPATISTTQNPATTPTSSCKDDHVRSAPLTITSRSPLTAYVRGSTFETTCSGPGSVETGNRMPDSSTCGTITRGMNCTA